jgi:hypothetical protein
MLAVGVYAICAATLSIQRVSSPTSKDMCDRVKVDMTVDQIVTQRGLLKDGNCCIVDGVKCFAPKTSDPIVIT